MHHYITILLLTLFWSPSAVLVKTLLNSIAPLSIVAYSSLIAAIMLISYQWLVHRKFFSYTKSQFFYCTLVGLLAHSLPFTLQCYALVYIPSIWLAIIIAAIPIFTVLLSPLFLNQEKIKKQLVYGILLGFIGMMVLISPSFIQTEPQEKNYLIGVVLSLIAAVMHALGLIVTRQKLRHSAPLAMPTLHMITATAYLLPVALILHPHDLTVFTHQSHLFIVLWLAIPGTALAYICYYKLLNQHPAVYISLINYILPMFKTSLGVIFLHETPTMSFIVAFILILSAILIVGEQSRQSTNLSIQPSNATHS